MKEFKFNKEYYMPILTGEKTQTLRKNKKRVRPGDIVLAVFSGTDFTQKLRITKIGYKQLKQTLMKIYPRIDKFDRLYYYRFKCID